MRKTGVIFLSVLYFLVATGITMNLHYCGGKLKDISFFQTKEDGCCGNKKKSKGCCKEKTLVYKVKSIHKTVAKTTIPNTSVKHFLANYVVLDFTCDKPSIKLYALLDCNAPPFLDPEPVYLLNRNFRI